MDEISLLYTSFKGSEPKWVWVDKEQKGREVSSDTCLKGLGSMHSLAMLKEISICVLNE